MAFTTKTDITAPTANVTAVTYLRESSTDYFYYATTEDRTKIFCASLASGATSLTRVSSRDITINSANNAPSNNCLGLTTDGTTIYAIVGPLGAHQAIHKYTISTRAFDQARSLGFLADHYAKGIEYYQATGETASYLVVLKHNNVVVAYDTSFNPQTARNFGLPSNLQVSSEEWQDICWDPSTQRLLLLGEGAVNNQGVDLLRGFSVQGTHDDREDLQFASGVDAGGMAYNTDKDDLILPHESSTTWYKYGDVPRWKLGNTPLIITQVTTYVLDLKPLVDNGATITAANAYNSASGLQNASLSNGVFTFTDPPAPTGGRRSQPLPLSFDAALGGHTTRQRFNFVLNARQVTFVPPSFGTNTIPRQSVYEPYTVPVGGTDPGLTHGFRLNMSDYLTAGTQPVTYTAARLSGTVSGRFQINSRFVNQQQIHDVLTFNATAVDAPTNGVIQVTASATDDDGVAHTATINIPVEVINLIYPTWHGSQDINLPDTGSHSYNIREDFLTAEPQADIQIFGIAPTQINANINNGVLTLRANQQTTTPQSYQLIVAATNILTTQAGVQRTFNVNVSAQAIPQAAPVWTSDAIALVTNRGETNKVDLNQYITQANPSPTFSVEGAAGALGMIHGEIVGQHFLQYTIPDGIVVDTHYALEVTATNSVDAASKAIQVTGRANTKPIVGPIPQQVAKTTEPWRLDLSDYVTSTSTVTYAFQSGYTPPGNMAITGSIISYSMIVAAANNTIVIPLALTNDFGTTNYSLPVFIEVLAAPVWAGVTLQFDLLEGTDGSWNLFDYIVSGSTPITLQFGPRFHSGSLNVRLHNGELQVMNAPQVNVDTLFDVPIVASNPTGGANKNVIIKVIARIALEEITRFSLDDYNAIRYLLGFEISRDEIPDLVISNDIYEQAAIDWVLEALPYDPNHQRTYINLRRKKRAAIYRCASLLAPHVPNLAEQSVGRIAKQVEGESWEDRARNLFNKAKTEVNLVNVSEGRSANYNLFSFTNGGS